MKRAHTPDVAALKCGSGSVTYDDSVTDLMFIALCRIAFGNKANWQSSQPWTTSDTYQGMVEVSRALMKNKTASEQRAAVISGFPQIPEWFRKAFPYSHKGAEQNAAITPLFFAWLVGPCAVTIIDVPGAGQLKSGVQIEQCRYLAESNCAAMCINLCKAPTQTFFTEQMGVPLTMEPNFEDYSCLMKFGVPPPSIENDPILNQSCLRNCLTGTEEKDKPCPTLC